MRRVLLCSSPLERAQYHRPSGPLTISELRCALSNSISMGASFDCSSCTRTFVESAEIYPRQSLPNCKSDATRFPPARTSIRSGSASASLNRRWVPSLARWSKRGCVSEAETSEVHVSRPSVSVTEKIDHRRSEPFIARLQKLGSYVRKRQCIAGCMVRQRPSFTERPVLSLRALRHDGIGAFA